MRSLIFLFLLISSYSLMAQDSTSVAVHKDPRIDLLVKKQIEINEVTTRNARRTAQGFRIQVISTNNRGKAMEVKSAMYRNFPDLAAYLIYQSPFYKVKVGNFREREDADAYLENIKRFYPSGVYVVRDIIEVKPNE